MIGSLLGCVQKVLALSRRPHLLPNPTLPPTLADKEAWPGCGARETVALVERLHQFDVMRANKAPFAWGLEPRVPFLDKAFLDVSMAIDPAEKMVRAHARRP